MWCAFSPARSRRRIFGRSPIETSPAWNALCVGPPDVYGWCEKASKDAFELQVGFGWLVLDMQRRPARNFIGAVDWPLTPANGPSAPATTTLLLLAARIGPYAAFSIAR